MYHLHSNYLCVWFWVLGSRQERFTQDWCARSVVFANAKAVRNQEQNGWVRQTNGNHACRLLSKHGVYPFSAILHEYLTKQIPASPLENWRRPPGRGRPCTTWMKTIQQDLKSNNLSLDEAINVAQNHPLWRLMSAFVWHYAPLVVHATQGEEDHLVPTSQFLGDLCSSGHS